MSPRIRILGLASFAVGTQALVFVGLLDRLAADLGVSVAAAGQLAALYALTFAILAPLAGALAGGLERRGVLTAALAVVAVLNMLCAVAPSYPMLAGLRIAAAVCATLVVPVASAAAATLAPPEQRGRAMAVVISGMSVALVLGVPLGAVVGDVFGWRSSFLFAALIAACAAVSIRTFLPRAPSRDRPGLGSLSVALRRPIALHLAVSMTSLTAIFCITTYVAPVVNAVTGLSGAGVGAMQMTSGLGAVAGALLGGRMADAEGAGRRLVQAFVLAILAQVGVAALLFTAPEGGGGPVFIFLLGAAFFTIACASFAAAPTIQRRLSMLAPEAQNVALALNGSMIFLGQAAGGAVGGAVIAGASLPWVGVAATASALVSLGMFGLAEAELRRHPAAAPA